MVVEHLLRSLGCALGGVLASLIVAIPWALVMTSLPRFWFGLALMFARAVFFLPTLLVILVVIKIPGFDILGFPKILMAFGYLNGPIVGAQIASAWVHDGYRSSEIFKVAGVLGLKRLELWVKFFYHHTASWLWLIAILCFTSFTIPLVLGGLKWRTLEVAIYEKIFRDYQIWDAVILSLVQIVCVFFLWRNVPRKSELPAEPRFYGKKAYIVFLLFLMSLWVVPLIPRKIWSGDVLAASWLSFQLGIGVVLTVGLGLLVMFVCASFEKFLPTWLVNGVSAIPPVTLSVGILLLSLLRGQSFWFLAILAQSMMIFPWVVQLLGLQDRFMWKRIREVGKVNVTGSFSYLKNVASPWIIRQQLLALPLIFGASISDMSALAVIWQDPDKPLSLLVGEKLMRFNIDGAESLAFWILIVFLVLQLPSVLLAKRSV